MVTVDDSLYSKMPKEIQECFYKLPNDGSDEVEAVFPNSKGDSRTSKPTYDKGHWGNSKSVESTALYNDSGSASRFFYTAKASKSERNAGLEGFEDRVLDIGDERPSGGSWERRTGKKPQPTKNHHPTVKPLALTKYLATLIKPPSRANTECRLLVPFSGSGSEMIGALQAGWDYVEGVELTEEYIPIAEARIKHWTAKEETKQMELV